MIVCKKCGHRNEENDVFCGSCGEYLEWTGEKIDEPAPIQAPPRPPPLQETGDAPGLIQRVKAKIGLEEDAAGPAEVPAASEAPPPAPIRTAPSTPPPPPTRVLRKAESPAPDDPNKTVLMPRIEPPKPAPQRRSVNRQADPDATQAMPAPPSEPVRRAPAPTPVPPPDRPGIRATPPVGPELRGVPPSSPPSNAEPADASLGSAVSEREAPATPPPDTQELERLRRDEEWKARLEREDRERLAEEERARLAALERAKLEKEERRQKAAALRARPPSKPPPAPIPPPVPLTPDSPAIPQAPGQPAVPDSPGARQPVPVPPSRSKPPKPPVVAAPPSEPHKEGDLICGECGTGNRPERKFCRRCGNSLSQAEVVAAKRIPWWRRIFSREQRVHTAGERPMRGKRRSGGTLGRTIRILSLVIALGGGLLALGPGRSFVTTRSKDLVAQVRGMFPTEISPVRPVRSEASSQLSDHPSMHAIDRGTNTYWCEGIPGNGEHQSINLVFEPPADIDIVRISSGAPGKDFLLQPRPKDLFLTFSDGSTQNLSLKDQHEFQEFNVTGRAAANVKVEILSVYPGTAGQNTSITELEFFDES